MAVLLNRIDAVPLDWQILSQPLNSWMSNLVNELNNIIETLEINVTSQALVVPSKTTAEITALLPNASIGSQWFNVDLGKMQIVVAASTLETITST